MNCTEFFKVVRRTFGANLTAEGFVEQATNPQFRPFDNCSVQYMNGSYLVEMVKDRDELFIYCGWKPRRGERIKKSFLETFIVLVDGDKTASLTMMNHCSANVEDPNVWARYSDLLDRYLHRICILFEDSESSDIEKQMRRIEEVFTDQMLEDISTRSLNPRH